MPPVLQTECGEFCKFQGLDLIEPGNSCRIPWCACLLTILVCLSILRSNIGVGKEGEACIDACRDT